MPKKPKTPAVPAKWLGGAKGFFQWCADIQPRILTGRNRYEPFTPEPWQEEAVAGILAVDPKGDFLNDMALLVTPRRHGKTNLFGLIILWIATTRTFHNIQVLGNTEEHATRVQMKTLKGIIQQTPLLAGLIPEKDINRLAIKVAATGSTIQTAAVNMASSFGDKLNVLWVGDFHASVDRGPFDAFQAALLDSQNTLCLIDANPDCEGGHVHQIEQQATSDPKTYCRRIEYADFEEYKAKAPAWIDRDKAWKLRSTSLETAWKRDILGQRTAAVNALFQPEDIAACVADYSLPVAPAVLPEMLNGRKHVIGCGLDKARAIKITSNDKTVWTVVVKVARDDGEPEFWVVDQQAITFATNKRCKSVIDKTAKEYQPHRIALEAYETEDILLWGLDRGLPVETASASAQQQYPVFAGMHEIVKEGRLHISRDCKDLLAEMGTFMVDDSTRIPSFGHAGGFHDDHVYSLAWAIWALRGEELYTYELDGIQCHSKSQHAPLCFLRGGELALPCSRDCLAFLKVQEWHNQYRAMKPESDLTLPEFFKNKVKFSGFAIWHHM